MKRARLRSEWVEGAAFPEEFSLDVAQDVVSVSCSTPWSACELRQRIARGIPFEVRMGASPLCAVFSLRIMNLEWMDALYHAGFDKGSFFGLGGCSVASLHASHASIRLYLADADSRRPILAYEGALPESFSHAFGCMVARQLSHPTSVADVWDELAAAYQGEDAARLAAHATHRFLGRTYCCTGQEWGRGDVACRVLPDVRSAVA